MMSTSFRSKQQQHPHLGGQGQHNISRMKPLQKLWNDVDNLNVTTRGINQPKGDAFERWIRKRDDNLRDALLYYNLGANIRAKVCVAFEESSTSMQRELDEIMQSTGLDLYGDVACALDDWANKTG
ncbi:hypothetical protein DUNSADRAFT_5442 [Dunaliella salina]|uniref:Uncharacterized protein n=1 Tax=Dunaliella salina TaxID=3046 RepID=A0ABQ7GQE9_DUNSA|nr:hypothetical protein DUNSADRAFT_5442 [Dunaliella salina]|eukprot:KAF5836753.1 hypothetical protein DUNSADRAFT_5442 [Dunaliella salina]